MANIHFRKLDLSTDQDLLYIKKWQEDPQIRHLSQVNQNEEDLFKVESLEKLRENYTKKQEKITILMILLDGKIVGEMSYTIDPKQLHVRISNTAWIGIIIGEASARGKGVGTVAMQHLEKEALLAGTKRFELGAFEFNTNAISLYKKLGYQEIARLPNFTYWNGKMWSDIRMEKFP